MRIAFVASPCFVFALFLSLALGSCSAAHAREDGTPDSAPGTTRMREILSEIQATANPRLCYHMNSQRAEQIGNRISQLPVAQQGPMRFQYATELLNAGETEEAIAELTSLLDEIGIASEAPIPVQVKAIYDILAVAHMRLGEQQNCVAHHSIDSCIFPIQGDGVHALEYGSRTAIDIYARLLSNFPDDTQSKYLLNLAYMTVGQYPDDVPDAALIPPAAFDSGAEFPRFSDISAQLGLGVVGLSGGCCVEDFDGNGYLDVLASSYGLADQVRFFLNDGEGGFRDATQSAGLTGIVSGLNMIHADYDNDGLEDVFILRGAWLGAGGNHPNSLLHNLGEGRFEDVTEAAGLLSYRPTQTAAWADFDNDGLLDLFIGNESTRRPSGELSISHPCELYRNDGDGTFTEVAMEVGLHIEEFVKGVHWGDIDDDGLQDLYVSVLGGKNRLYRNLGGEPGAKWSFENIGAAAGVEDPFFSFPTWFFDFDNDGDQDLFVSGYDLRHLSEVGSDFGKELLGEEPTSERVRLYRNDGDLTFTDVSRAQGLDLVAYTMGSNFGDLDNDGFLDIYLGTGAPDFRSIVPNRMFWNRSGTHFEDITVAGGFGHLQKGHGVAFGDIDNDGDQDIYTVMGGAYEGDVFANVLFENPGSENSWITIDLEGRDSNRSAIGARVSVEVEAADGSVRHHHSTVNTGGSFGSSSLQQEIGLGDATKIRSLVVQWGGPASTVDRFTKVSLDQAYQLSESGKLKRMDRNVLTFSAADARDDHHGHGTHDHN